MTKHNSIYDHWLTFMGAGLLLFGGLMSGCDNSSGPAPTPTGASSPEHRYVRERFRQEGYSDREAQQAADAIIKFNNAQKNR